MTGSTGSAGGWRVSRSIGLEINVAISYMHTAPAMLPKSLVDLVTAIPTSWIAEFGVLCREAAANPQEVSIFEFLGRWGNVQEVDDYDTASAAMREISPEDVIGHVVAATGLEPSPDLSPIDTVVDLEARVAADLWPRYGLQVSSDAAVVQHEREVSRMAAMCLRGGPLHGRFWHWVDRFYYDVYGSWRQDHLDVIEALERTAIAGLGSRRGDRPPQLGWLTPDSPLVAAPAVAAVAQSGQFEVVFWAEPFGLSSSILAAPGLFLSSFADHGIDVEWHETIRDDLAMKLKALADPTRLSVLRVVRNMDFDNTQLANLLEVSRPTISVHAKVLADAGFISTRREGRQARHTPHPAEIRRLCEDLLRWLDVPDHPADE